jgi:CP family cyanate transporter-like MFS transporter
MGLQALSFFAVLSWLPSVYRSYGMSPEAAGQLLSVMLILAVPTALILPNLLTRSTQQSGWSVVTVTFIGAGLLGLLVAPRAYPYLWTILIGIGMGAGFPLALTLAVLRSRSAQDAAQLSAMSQSVGYALAAIGPLVFGLLHDLSDNWVVPLVFLLALLVPQAVVGFGAGRAMYVHDARTHRAR